MQAAKAGKTPTLDELLEDLADQPTTAQWSRDNADRRTIAEVLGVPVATWTSRTKGAKTETRDARRLARAVEAITALPRAGEYLHIITGQEFRGFDLLPAMLKLAKARRFDALTLTTLGFSRENLADLAAMIEAAQILPARLRILCSDFFRRADREIWRTGADQARRLGYDFRSTRNHTKLILAKIGRRFYVVESSANLRSCANLEQFTLTQSRKLYDFHESWLNQVWQTAEI